MHGEGREQRREAGRAVAVLRKDLKEVMKGFCRQRPFQARGQLGKGLRQQCACPVLGIARVERERV